MSRERKQYTVRDGGGNEWEFESSAESSSEVIAEAWAEVAAEYLDRLPIHAFAELTLVGADGEELESRIYVRQPAEPECPDGDHEWSHELSRGLPIRGGAGDEMTITDECQKCNLQRAEHSPQNMPQDGRLNHWGEYTQITYTFA